MKNNILLILLRLIIILYLREKEERSIFRCHSFCECCDTTKKMMNKKGKEKRRWDYSSFF